MKSFFSFALAFVLFLQSFAQQKDSLAYDIPYKFNYKQLIVPTAAVAAGTAIMLSEKRAELVPGKKSIGYLGYFEDWAIYGPTVANAAMDLAGMKSRTDGANKLAIGVKSSIITLGTVTAMKYLTKQNRPDGTDNKGFPSGHAATVFAGATALSIEYQDDYPWIPYAAYTFASGISALRVVHNKHYWSDVLVGAGIGILSSKIAYWTHRYRWKTKKPHDIFSGVYYDPIK